jgi:hypothetical protein
MARKRIVCSNKEAVLAYRRVLRLVGSFIKKDKPLDTLTTNGQALMTWRELLFHIDESLNLKHTLVK